jgi:hypothetical protein
MVLTASTRRAHAAAPTWARRVDAASQIATLAAFAHPTSRRVSLRTGKITGNFSFILSVRFFTTNFNVDFMPSKIYPP